MRSFFAVVFVSIALQTFAQDPAPDPFIEDSLAITRVKLVRPQFRFDNRITFSEKQALSITGFDAGVLLNDKLRLTLGYYAMSHRLEAYDEVREGETFGRVVDMKYGSFNSEFIYKDTRFLSLGMPLEIAAGYNRIRDENTTTGEVLATQSGALIFVNFGMSATFKPLRFLGLKGVVGYRKVAYNQVEDFNFDGFFTSIGLNIDAHAIVSDIKMYRLMKRYGRGNKIANAVNIITD